MRWTEVEFQLKPLDPWRDILLAELADRGFEGFEETREGLKAFVPSSSFNPGVLRGISVLRDPHVRASHAIREVPEANWNEQWESSFTPVEVQGRVRIRAEFHEPVPGWEHELVITPRMAFGTGHHATTRMMIGAMLGLDLKGKQVCDLGCGTAVLAILAERLGAARVLAIDNDEQAVANAMENVARNHCERVVVEKGDAGRLKPMGHGAILANIERNTLLRSMEAMHNALLPGGVLLMSGFVREDARAMQEAADRSGMPCVSVREEGEWALVECIKGQPAK